MTRALSRAPRCIVIAGPNGAGKTTFAREFLPKEARVAHFVQQHYRPLADAWAVHDNSGDTPKLIEQGP
jgi:predicted ABC-type ATPase